MIHLAGIFYMGLVPSMFKFGRPYYTLIGFSVANYVSCLVLHRIFDKYVKQQEESL